MKTQIVFLFICLATAYCAQMIEMSPASEEEQEDGYTCKSNIESLGLMEANEVRSNYQEGTCSQATCFNDGTIIHTTCGAVSAEGCELVEDLRKPYPKCCPTPRC